MGECVVSARSVEAVRTGANSAHGRMRSVCKVAIYKVIAFGTTTSNSTDYFCTQSRPAINKHVDTPGIDGLDVCSTRLASTGRHHNATH